MAGVEPHLFSASSCWRSLLASVHLFECKLAAPSMESPVRSTGSPSSCSAAVRAPLPSWASLNWILLFGRWLSNLHKPDFFNPRHRSLSSLVFPRLPLHAYAMENWARPRPRPSAPLSSSRSFSGPRSIWRLIPRQSMDCSRPMFAGLTRRGPESWMPSRAVLPRAGSECLAEFRGRGIQQRGPADLFGARARTLKQPAARPIGGCWASWSKPRVATESLLRLEQLELRRRGACGPLRGDVRSSLEELKFARRCRVPGLLRCRGSPMARFQSNGMRLADFARGARSPRDEAGGGHGQAPALRHRSSRPRSGAGHGPGGHRGRPGQMTKAARASTAC